jgi:hypothetical protein
MLKFQVGMIDDIWQNDFDHKETTFSRQNGPAVAEDPDCCHILIAVQHGSGDIILISTMRHVAARA